MSRTAPPSAPQVTTPLATVYLLHGDDELSKHVFLGAIRAAAITPEFRDFDEEVLDGAASTANAVGAACAQVPFGSERRLVVVTGAETFRRRERQTEGDALAGAIGRTPPTCCLVLVAGAPAEGSKAKTVLSSKLDAAVRGHGQVVEFRAPDAAALAAWLMEQCVANGKQLIRAAADLLVCAAQGDRQIAAMELEKVMAFVGDAPRIVEADVAAVCVRDPEDVIFKVVEAVGLRDATSALTSLQELLRYDSKAHGVAGRLISLLSRQLKLLWQAHHLTLAGYGPRDVRELPAEVASCLPSDASLVPLAWRARELFGAARGWSTGALCIAFGLLAECDAANKGGTDGTEDVVANLQLLVAKLCSTR